MFRKIGFIILLLAIPVIAFSSQEKIYVSLDQISFESDGIWLTLPQGPKASFQAIHIDSFGYYVAKEENSNWVCPKCGFLNMRQYGRYGCERCGFPYD